MATFSDYLLTSALTGKSGFYVRLLNNSSGTSYISDTVTDVNGKFTFNPTSPPPGSYTVFYGLAATVPGTATATGDANYLVPVSAGDDAALKSLTVLLSGPYNASGAPGTVNAIDRDWGGYLYHLKSSLNPGGAAKFDGVTDDTVSIAAGETAAAAAGGIVGMPVGVGVSGQLTKQSLAHWRGAGVGATVLKLKNGANVALVKGASFDTLTGGNTTGGIHSWSIRDMSFDGNLANNGAMTVPLIQVYGYGYFMDYFNIFNAKNVGLYSEWSTLTTNPNEGFEAKLSNFCINFSGSDGIQWAGPHDSLWWNGTLEVNSGHGVWLKAGGAATEMSNVHSWGAQQDWGVFADVVFYASNCQFEGNGTGGIWARANGIQMTGGLLYGQPIGMRIGVTAGVAPTGIGLKNVLCNNLSTTIIDVQNDGGNNTIDYIDLGGNAAVSAGPISTTTGVIKNGNQFRTFGGTGTLQVIDTGASGVSIYLLGDGGATPSKRIRVKGGLFQILDDAGSGTPFQMTDAGIVYVGKGASGPFVSQSVGANPAVWDTFNSGQGHKFTNNNAATLLAELASTGFLSTYGSATVQGTGVPAIYRAPAPSLAQTAAVASIATITSPNDGVKHVYRVSGAVTITTLGSGNINLQVTYTDSNGTARTCNIPLCAQAGTFAASATTADDYKGVVEITVNPNTVITVLTAGTFTGCTYNTSGQIERVL